jgi:hypothetical protein
VDLATADYTDIVYTMKIVNDVGQHLVVAVADSPDVPGSDQVLSV